MAACRQATEDKFPDTLSPKVLQIIPFRQNNSKGWCWEDVTLLGHKKTNEEGEEEGAGLGCRNSIFGWNIMMNCEWWRWRFYFYSNLISQSSSTACPVSLRVIIVPQNLRMRGNGLEWSGPGEKIQWNLGKINNAGTRIVNLLIGPCMWDISTR